MLLAIGSIKFYIIWLIIFLLVSTGLYIQDLPLTVTKAVTHRPHVGSYCPHTTGYTANELQSFKRVEFKNFHLESSYATIHIYIN